MLTQTSIHLMAMVDKRSRLLNHWLLIVLLCPLDKLGLPHLTLFPSAINVPNTEIIIKRVFTCEAASWRMLTVSRLMCQGCHLWSLQQCSGS
jgi:hypothetical protein